MPNTTHDAFDEFDENLKLDPDERAIAEKVHNEITALLIDKRLIISAFLQGSFRRKTMIAPLRDVDKVVILHPDLDGLDPDEVMDRLQEVLRIAYPDVTFKRSRHSLEIDFGPDSFYFDTVPARETDTDDDDILIANRDTGGWDPSNTRKLIRVVAERNQETDGVWIHQVRMAKQVIKNLLNGVIPGLHVESWAYIAITSGIDHDEALTTVLETGAALLGGTYTEPTGTETISDRLKPDAIATAKPVVEGAARRAREARNLTDAGDHNESIRIWHELCGDCFPEPAAQDAATALGRAFHGGSLTRSGTVTTSTAGAQPIKPTRSWTSA
jgi:Second Messenger Oligonucleotide or Dinucleotide Synthetase domain